MALVSELELPAFDYTDASMRGDRFHRAMEEVRARGWLAEGPYGYIALDRESAEFFLRTRAAVLPGVENAEVIGGARGPAERADEAQHPARQRARPHPPAQPRQSGALAAGRGALPPGHAGVP